MVCGSTTTTATILYTVLVVVVSLVHNGSAFTTTTSPCFYASRRMTTMRMSQWDDESSEGSLSFDEAGRALIEEEDAARAERSGSQISDEEKLKFEEKRSEYDSMRDQIRARASDLNIEKSVTTQKAIEEANRRAVAREESPEVDLSKIVMGGLGGDSEPEDELTDEEMASIDKVGQMGLWGQVLSEFEGTKFPGVGATVRQTGFMFVIFVVTSTAILLADETVRNLYTDLGFIPRPDQVFDYSDLELPDGWSDMMTDADMPK